MSNKSQESPQLDTSSRTEFFEYYKDASESDEAIYRFESIKNTVLGVLKKQRGDVQSLVVGDVGCGAGAQSIMWAEEGHHVYALDINEPLIELARERIVNKESLNIDFYIGTAEELPWEDSSLDVCLVPELLEHVRNWEGCLNEFKRVLKPDGILFLSTDNKLCPVQQEFNLPLYSWYPAFLKKYYEKLSVTTKPELVNFATYPAVNWFSYYGLRKEMSKRGFVSMDRFDVKQSKDLSLIGRVALAIFRSNPLSRFIGHVCTPYTQIISIKK